MKKEKWYEDPVIFIVHSPLPRLISKKYRELHLKKMKNLINFAKRHNLPVVYGVRSVFTEGMVNEEI